MKFYHCYCRSNAVHGSGQKKIVYVILIIAELAGGRPTAKPTLHEFTLRPTSPLILSVDLLVTRIAALDAFTKTLFDGWPCIGATATLVAPRSVLDCNLY